MRKEGRCRQFVQLHITANAQITFCDNASCSSASASASVDRGGAGAAPHLARCWAFDKSRPLNDGAQAASEKIYRNTQPSSTLM